MLIAYDDLRIANSKLIELEYQKRININLRQIIYNDSAIIKKYENINIKLKKDCEKHIRQRNVCLGITIIAIISSTIIAIK